LAGGVFSGRIRFARDSAGKHAASYAARKIHFHDFREFETASIDAGKNQSYTVA